MRIPAPDLYFIAQLGIAKNTPMRSNFYVYRIRGSFLGKLEAAVKNAGRDSSGLTYPKGFLEWLEANDLKAQQLDV